jgi:hypothetical protein
MITFKQKGKSYEAKLDAKQFNFNQGETIILRKGDAIVIEGTITKIIRDLDLDRQREYCIVVEVE